MTIYVNSKADLAAMLSVAAGVVITVSDLVFGIPRPTTTDEQTQYGRNTRVKISFASTSTVGTGERAVFYDRLDLVPLLKANFHGAKVAAGANLASILPIIKNYTGAVLDADDLVEASTYLNEATLGVEFLMTAKATSFGWTGSGLLKFDPPVPIATAFVDDTLPGFN